MRYLMLIHHGTSPLPGSDEWNAKSPEEQKQVYADWGAFNEIESVTAGEPMGTADEATTVRVADGETLVTDGPYAELKDAVGGYFFLEAEDLDEAIAIAAKVPAARLGGGIEIRALGQKYW